MPTSFRLPLRRFTLVARLACLALVAFTSACDDDSFSYARIDHVSGDPNATFSLEKISVPVGEALIARIQLFNDDDDQLTGQLVSDDPTVLQIRAAENDSTYALLGVHAGSTVVRVLADGIEVKSIPAVVSAQPSQ